jgi:hypothetical protein
MLAKPTVPVPVSGSGSGKEEREIFMVQVERIFAYISMMFLNSTMFSNILPVFYQCSTYIPNLASTESLSEVQC